jgi:hypothetical protein
MDCVSLAGEKFLIAICSRLACSLYMSLLTQIRIAKTDASPL